MPGYAGDGVTSRGDARSRYDTQQVTLWPMAMPRQRLLGAALHTLRAVRRHVSGLLRKTEVLYTCNAWSKLFLWVRGQSRVRGHLRPGQDQGSQDRGCGNKPPPSTLPTHHGQSVRWVARPHTITSTRRVPHTQFNQAAQALWHFPAIQ
jgi:hypothetical protein